MRLAAHFLVLFVLKHYRPSNQISRHGTVLPIPCEVFPARVPVMMILRTSMAANRDNRCPYQVSEKSCSPPRRSHSDRLGPCGLAMWLGLAVCGIGGRSSELPLWAGAGSGTTWTLSRLRTVIRRKYRSQRWDGWPLHRWGRNPWRKSSILHGFDSGLATSSDPGGYSKLFIQATVPPVALPQSGKWEQASLVGNR